MTIVALIILVIISVAWAAAFGTLIYGLITEHRYVKGMFAALLFITAVSVGAIAGADTFLKHEFE